MTIPSAATRHVVERCPCCGVEHDVSADSLCEACDTPLRAWCRTHSREFGWLDGESCPRCAREAAPRVAPPPRENPSSAPRRPAVVPTRPLPPPRPPTREVLSKFDEPDVPHDRMASPQLPWGEALTQTAVMTAGGAVGGVVGGCITALAVSADVASMAGAAAAMLGFAGFAIGAALGCAIVLEDA
jgi:hypothetical protein